MARTRPSGRRSALSESGESEAGTRPLRVLVIDDEKNIRATLAACLEAMGCTVSQAASRAAALSAVRQGRHDLAFLDLRLGAEDGLELLPELLAENVNLEVVVVTAYATVKTAVEAIRRGARDYLAKPFEPAQIQHVVDRVRELLRLERQVVDLRSRLGEAVPDVDLATASPGLQTALQILRRAAGSDAAVLLKGESGTGKSVFARALHAMSPRRHGAFVVVNCPTLSEELLSSELFGHARGSFTGALRDQPGKVEAAEGGTLFLDEISEIPVSVQAKLLRFVQDREFERVGETRTRRADVRVVAASNRDLEAEVRAGRFREDLLYRLNVIEVVVPPLRERREDILPLARHFAAFFARAGKRAAPELSRDVQEMLLAYPWPGNVRELRNAMERALILWPADVLERGAFPDRIAGQSPEGPRLGGDHTLEELEAEHLRRVLARAPTLEEAARILGIDASTLWRKRKRLEEG
ncbi:MAG: sigma-54-dependent Fis family transcriptional regulator [Deltaproteobacteria bacterium]|nr:sigma-54-dependent Fis family transcriptional regulator [Deltaproteobacteria bacterium]